MVEEEVFGGEESFRCKFCGFHYRNGEDAEQCEELCEEKACAIQR